MSELKPGAARINCQSHIKMGVFFNKDAKITQLQTRNQELKQLLQKELTQFEHLSRQLQSSRTSQVSLESQNRLMEIQEMMLRQSLSKLQGQFEKLSPDIVQKEQIAGQLEAEVDKLAEALEVALAEQQQTSNLITRHREEIRLENAMAKSDKNLNSICESLKKTNENYEKNGFILASKLQSKKKYLGILTKKVQKARKEEKAVGQKKQGQKEMRSYHSAAKIGLPSRPNQEEREEGGAGKAGMKSYNDLIRRKNAILAKKK